jgi:enterochelin esterase-like enzyme
MQLANESVILSENITLTSRFLEREVRVDFYLPGTLSDTRDLGLLLINDGQDLSKMNFTTMLESLYAEQAIRPLLFAGIHASPERRMEYGTQLTEDFKGRGAKASLYTAFIFDELIPFIREKFGIASFREKAFAGFSLGALSAMDIVWNRPGEFTKVGLFSASLWWRSVDQVEAEYDDDLHRIMHQQVRNGTYAPWLKFFFQCGNMDETKDRNNNGIIDSIDDTLDLIGELKKKGYSDDAIHYLEIPDGHHDVATWGRAMPEFLKWAWGGKVENTK